MKIKYKNNIYDRVDKNTFYKQKDNSWILTKSKKLEKIYKKIKKLKKKWKELTCTD